MKTILLASRPRMGKKEASAHQTFSGRLQLRKPIVVMLSTIGALVALWAPVYLGLLDRSDSGTRSGLLEWLMLAIGVLGFTGMLYLAHKDTRDRTWRAAHGLPPASDRA